jgi:peptidyl-prolyl cis-trans isomerase B (cyclophilin B)
MKALILSCAFGLSLGLVSARAEDAKKETKEEPKKTESKEEKKSANTNEVAVLKTTEGEMVIEFWPDVAPKTVENFKKLTKEGFYDGTAFHRIMSGFMIQGGDPNTKDPAKEADYGGGGPGYTIPAEFNSRKHERGVISMARSNDPNSAGSQFFICHAPADNPGMQYLNGKYTAFGKLIKGDDVLEKLAKTPVGPNRFGEPSKPTKRVGLESVKIVPTDSVK